MNKTILWMRLRNVCSHELLILVQCMCLVCVTVNQLLIDFPGLHLHAAIYEIKNGLLSGKLVFLNATESYSQASVFVLMHGSLRTEKDLPTTPDEYTDPMSFEGDNGDRETIEFAAPCIFSWIMDPHVPAESFNFVAGSDGAMLVAAFPDRKAATKQSTAREASGVPIPRKPVSNSQNFAIASEKE